MHFSNVTSTTTDRCTPTVSLSPTHSHRHALKCQVSMCLSVGEVHGPQGTNSRSPLWGRGGGGCRPIREPRRNSLWNRDQPTDRDTTQLRGCSAADKLYSLFFLNPLSASSNPFLFVVNLMQFLQMNVLIQVVTKANKAQTLLVWGSICKQVVCSLIANRLDSHKCDNMKDLWLLELRNERSVW